MAVTREFLQKNPDTAERAMKAYIEAVGLMNHDKDATLKVLAKYFKRNDPSFLEETYGIVTKFTESIAGRRARCCYHPRVRAREGR